MTGLLGLALLLLVLSALVSAAETGIFSLGVSRLRTLREEGFKGAEELVDLRSDPASVEALFLFLNTLTNLFALGLFVGAGTVDWGIFGFALTLPGAALVVLLLGELVPRALTGRRPVRVALTAAPLVARVDRILRPVTGPLARLEGFLSRENSEGVTRDLREFREVATIGQQEGVVGADEHLLLERAFRLDEMMAWEVMTPRVDVFAWKDDLRLAEIIGELTHVPYSRIPVYGESVDDVTGILYIREAYEAYVAGRTDVPLSEISREPFFVPGSLPLTRLLGDFQARRIHMGIVADEFGGTDGLVTLEDVLEELVGEIVDETDIDEEPLIRISRTEIVADGGVDLREINHVFNVSLPMLEHRSLNGFILDDLGRVPDQGEIIEHDGLAIEIVEASETQVVRARIRKSPPAGSGDGSSD